MCDDLLRCVLETLTILLMLLLLPLLLYSLWFGFIG